MIGVLVIEHVVRAVLEGERTARGRSSRADDDRTRGTRELHRGRAHSTRGTVHQHHSGRALPNGANLAAV